MKNNGIEDIYIGADEKKSKKSKKSIIIVIFIILILVLAGLVGAYFYFSNKSVTKKQAFINGMQSTNIKKFMENDIYQEILSRTLNEDSETETKMTFSTTEEVEGIDVSNFELNLKNVNKINNSKSYGEFALNYSGNEIFKLKLLSTENEIGIASDDIVTKYVGVHYDKIKDTLGVDIDKKNLDELSNSSKIDLTSEEKNSYMQNYLSKAFEQIPEEKFSSNENIVVEKKSGQVNVVSYSLTLSQDELKNILTNTLTTLRNDQELLGKLVASNSSNTENQNIVSNTINSTDNTTTDNTTVTEENLNGAENTDENSNTTSNEAERAPMPSFETTNSSINIYEQTDSSEQQITSEEGTENNFNSSMTVDPENNIETVNVEGEVDVYNTVSENETDTINDESVISQDANIINQSEENDLISPELMSIIFGMKANISVTELQSQLDELIENIKKLEGNGLTINVYVNSNNVTEKINIILPDNSKIDLEFTTNSENQNDNSIQIIYTTENTTNNNSEADSNGVITYSAEDTINESTDTKAVSQKSGFELLLNEINNDANTTLKITFKNIENDAYNQEINAEVKTNGNKTSNSITNEIVINLKTDQNAIKLLLDNTIKFGSESETEIDELNTENCVFLDELPEEERAATIQAIVEKTMSVYQEKKEGLSFIDTNTNSTVIDPNLSNVSTNVTKENAKQALIDKFTELYQKSQDEGTEFTLHNLEGLTIDGYEVSTNITDEVAVIVVDTYTFKINSNFELSEE